MPTARKKAGTRASTGTARTKKAGAKLRKPSPPKAARKITAKTTDLQCVKIVRDFAGNVGDFMEKRAKYEAQLENRATKKTTKLLVMKAKPRAKAKTKAKKRK